MAWHENTSSRFYKKRREYSDLLVSYYNEQLNLISKGLRAKSTEEINNILVLGSTLDQKITKARNEVENTNYLRGVNVFIHPYSLSRARYPSNQMIKINVSPLTKDVNLEDIVFNLNQLSKIRDSLFYYDFIFVYTFVATRGNTSKQKIVENGKEITKLISKKRMIETHLEGAIPHNYTEEIQRIIPRIAEYVSKKNNYGFIYDESNMEEPPESWQFKLKVKPKEFKAKMEVYDHTYNALKASGEFILPDKWWLVPDDQLAELFYNHVNFYLKTRGGSSSQTKL